MMKFYDNKFYDNYAKELREQKEYEEFLKQEEIKKMGESKFYTRTYNTKCIVKCEIIGDVVQETYIESNGKSVYIVVYLDHKETCRSLVAKL